MEQGNVALFSLTFVPPFRSSCMKSNLERCSFIFIVLLAKVLRLGKRFLFLILGSPLPFSPFLSVSPPIIVWDRFSFSILRACFYFWLSADAGFSTNTFLEFALVRFLPFSLPAFWSPLYYPLLGSLPLPLFLSSPAFTSFR